LTMPSAMTTFDSYFLMKTTLPKIDSIEKKWYLIDAEGKTLGRLAVTIANLLRGRNKPIYTPHLDTGDFVIVINADKVKLTGKKKEQKEYMFFSGWRGNEKYINVEDMLKKRPTFVLEHAVKGMLPGNRLARQIIKKLKIYASSEHPHEAQNPIPYDA